MSLKLALTTIKEKQNIEKFDIFRRFENFENPR